MGQSNKRRDSPVIIVLGVGCFLFSLYWFANSWFLRKMEIPIVATSVTNNIVVALEAFGLEPQVEHISHSIAESNAFLPLTSLWEANNQKIIATIPGTSKSGTIIVVAKYHNELSVDDSLGGKSSVFLLNLIVSLQKLPRLKNDITFLFSNTDLINRNRQQSGLSTNYLVQQNEVVLKVEDQNLPEIRLSYFSSKPWYRFIQDFAQKTSSLSTDEPSSVQPKNNSVLELIQYLGNQPFSQGTGSPEDAISVLVNPITGIYNPHLKSIDEAVRRFMKKWNIPGGAVAISKNERLVYARGFGFAHQETQTLVQPESIFRIASLSKPITAVAIMKLVQEGLLQLDSKVFGPVGVLSDSTYGLIADERVKDITIRHLLEHSAGWDRAVSGNLMFDPVNIAHKMQILPPADTKNIIRFVLSRPLDFVPGSRYAYCNLGYGILGRVIEQITHTNYEEYVKSFILKPLGITNMHIGNSLPEPQEPGEVWYYPSLRGSLAPSMYGLNIQVPFAYGGFNLEAMDSHGGWIASAPDLLRWMAAVDGFSNKPDILSPNILQLMVTPSATLNSGYGLGWWVNDQNNWCHTGSLPGSSTLMERNQNGYSWVILFNRRSEVESYFDELYFLLRNEIKEVEQWPEYDLFELADSVSIPSITLPSTSSLTNLPRKNSSF